MKQFFQLTWLQIKLSSGLTELRAMLRRGGKDTAKAIGTMLAILIGFGAIIGMVAWLLDMLFGVVSMMPVLQDTLLTVVLLVSMIVVLIFGVVYGMSMYYAKDTEFLASLPIKRGTVFASKFIKTLLGEILIFAVIALPTFIVYALHTHLTAGYILKAVLVLLAGPVIPFALANLIAAVLVRISLFSRHKDKFAVALGLLFFLAYMFGIQFISAKMQTISSEQILALLNGGLLDGIASAFPPASWAAKSLVYTDASGWINLLLFIGVAAVALGVCLWVAGKMYMKGASAQTETSKTQKKVDLKKLGGKRISQRRAIFNKEWKLIFRSPTYALNSLLIVAMPLIMVAIMLFTPSLYADGADAEMGMLIAELNAHVEWMPYVVLVIGALGALFCSMNPGPMTVYSREGECVWLPLALPVSGKTVAQGKALFGLSMHAVSLALLGGALLFAAKIPVWVALAGVVFGLLMALPMLLLDTMMDLRSPNLHWESEQKAMKSNFKAAAEMLLGMVLVGALIALCVWLLIEGIDAWLLIGALSAVMLLVSAGLYALLCSKSERWQSQLSEK